MRSLRDYVDPGGRKLGRRLDQLRRTLEGLTERLRSAVAGVIGETISGIVQDAVMCVLQDLSQRLPGLMPFSSLPRQMHDRYQQRDLDGYDPQEYGFWEEKDEEEFDREPKSEPEPVEASPGRWSIALSTALQASSWWLRRCSSNHRPLVTLAVGLFAGGIAYVAGPLAVAVLSLAGMASQLNSMADVVNHSATAFHFFHPA